MDGYIYDFSSGFLWTISNSVTHAQNFFRDTSATKSAVLYQKLKVREVFFKIKYHEVQPELIGMVPAGQKLLLPGNSNKC